MDVSELIKRHEGERLKPYTDSVGKLTIGVGRNLTDNGITPDESAAMLKHDIQSAWDECAKYGWFLPLSDARKAACIDLMFNVGPNSFRTFQRFIAAMGRNDWPAAYSELANSSWHKQVGKRAAEVEALILYEQWP
jgi:lysozyme